MPESHRIGPEGAGFKILLDSINPERILVAAEAVGIGPAVAEQGAGLCGGSGGCLAGRLEEPSYSASAGGELDGVGGGRFDGVEAARQYDSGEPCGAHAKAAKYLQPRRRFMPVTGQCGHMAGWLCEGISCGALFP